MGRAMAGGAQISGTGMMMMTISAANWHGLRGCTAARPIGGWRPVDERRAAACGRLGATRRRRRCQTRQHLVAP